MDTGQYIWYEHCWIITMKDHEYLVGCYARVIVGTWENCTLLVQTTGYQYKYWILMWMVCMRVNRYVDDIWT